MIHPSAFTLRQTNFVWCIAAVSVASAGFALLAFVFVQTSHPTSASGGIFPTLPARLRQSKPLDFPFEIALRLDAHGRAHFAGTPYRLHQQGQADRLRQRLADFRAIAVDAGSRSSVTIIADGDAPHGDVRTLLSLCAQVGIRDIQLR